VNAYSAIYKRSPFLLQNSSHKLLHSVLVNNTSRDAALNFIQEVLVRNVKRQQIQVNERMVAGDGFMLNFLSVMQHLAGKVTMDKVDPLYLHSPKSRVNISEDTRLNMTSKEAQEWIEQMSKNKNIKVLTILDNSRRPRRAFKNLECSRATFLMFGCFKKLSQASVQCGGLHACLPRQCSGLNQSRLRTNFSDLWSYLLT
jgi:hypothetical protein